MTISVRLTDEDTLLVKKYAKLKGMSVSAFVRQVVFERIENEYDLAVFNEAIEEYRKKPVTYTHEEAVRMLLEEE